MITLVAAMGRNWVIGNGAEIPWKLPGDVKHFKDFTLGHAIVMGRTTWDTVGKPLPKRVNVVLSRDARFAPEGAVVVRSIDEAFAASEREKPGDEVMVIGGAKIYALALERADRIVLTVVDGVFEGDVFFPRFAAGAGEGGWRCVGHTAHEKNERDLHNWVVFDWRKQGSENGDARREWEAMVQGA